MLITNENGQRIGYVGDQYVDEIPGAYGGFVDGGEGFEVEPIYTLPLTDTYTILLDGQTLTQTVTVTVTQFGPGYAASVSNITLDSDSADWLTIASDGPMLFYQSNEAKESILMLNLEGDNESYQFTIRGADIGAEGVVLAVDTTSEQLVFMNKQTDDGEYNLDIRYISAEEDRQFIHTSLDISAMETHYLDYSTWGEAGSITMYIDRGIDGSLDETIILNNQTYQIYLPVTLRNR